MMWVKLRQSSSIGNSSSAGDEDEQIMMLQEKNVVDEEYNQALHTKSFMELYSEVQGHSHRNLNRSSTTITPKSTRGEVLLHHSHSLELINADRSLHSEVIVPLINNNNRHSCCSCTASRSFHHHVNTLLLDFFDATNKSITACTSLLSSIACARSHHRSVHRLLLNVPSPSEASISKLSSSLNLPNPLSPQNLSRFHRVHSYYPALICQLTSAHRRMVRRSKWWFVGLVNKVERSARKRVDAAARGAYIIGRDMDTMSVMLRRVHDEVEHGRDLARMVVRNGEMWGFLMKEIEKREVGKGTEEQLKELEEHVYLCLVTISRSRRLVAKEMHE